MSEREELIATLNSWGEQPLATSDVTQSGVESAADWLLADGWHKIDVPKPKRHEHERWMLETDGNGHQYCKACGQTVTPERGTSNE